MRDRLRSVGVHAAALVGIGACLPGCILDFSGLTDEGRGGGGGAGTCDLLSCCPNEQAIVVAGPGSAGLARDIAVLPNGLVWTDEEGGAVLFLGAAGEAPSALATSAGARAISGAGDAITWTAADGVHRCQASDCAATEGLLAGGLAAASARDVTADGTTVLWSDRGAAQGEGRIRACEAASCVPVDLGGGLIAAERVALRGNTAFWTDRGTGDTNGTVARSPKNAPESAQIAAALDFPAGVAADDANVVWTEDAPSGRVWRCPWTRGYCDVPEEVAEGPFGAPSDIVLAGGRVYWMNVGDGNIVSCPQPGCAPGEAPKVHVSGRQGLTAMAVGASCLFWTEQANGGAVMKAAR